MGKKYFDNWEIAEELGSGAFGTVYKIKKEEFGNTYYSAMKVIRIPQSDSEKNKLRAEGLSEVSLSKYYDQCVQDFVNEIKVMVSLQGNTNIVAYNDHKIVRNADGIGYVIYIRMEYLIPLEAYLLNAGQVRTLSEKEVIQLGIDMCNALEVCEKYNIIHRDIKPDNIFISKSGNYKLGDFGIARQLEGTQAYLSKKGTYSYMAPEVYNGTTYNNTVDIYSLGIVLYKLLNHGRLPFLPPFPAPIKYSDSENALLKRMQGVAIPEIQGLPERLNYILLKCCAFRSQERYQSVGDLKRDLESYRLSPYAKPNQYNNTMSDTGTKTVYMEQPVPLITPSTNTIPQKPAVHDPRLSREAQQSINNPPPNIPVVPNPTGTENRLPPPTPSKGMDKKLLIALICIGVVIIAAATALIIHFAAKKRSTSSDIITTSAVSQSIRETTSASVNKKKGTTRKIEQSAFSDVDADLRSIIKSSAADTESLVLLDLQSDEMQSYGSSKTTSASALVIYPVLYAYEYVIDAGQLTKSTTVPVIINSSGRGKLDDSDEGELYTVDDLFYYAFRYSDNNAMNSLIKYLGQDYITQICYEAGYSSISVEKYVGVSTPGKDNYADAADLAKMVRDMIKNRSFGNAIMSEYSQSIADEHGKMGIAYTLDSKYEMMNGYTQEIYNEAVHIADTKRDWVVIYLSESSQYTDGVKTAERIGDCLK